MKTLLLRAGVTAAAVVLTLGVSAAPGHAATEAPTSQTPGFTAAPATWTTAGGAGLAARSAEARAEAYWTPERMRKALPADVPAGTVRTPRVAKPTGKPVRIPGAKATEAPAKAGLTKSVAAAAVTASATVGKVFYRDPNKNADMVCSASAVNSNSKSLVATAGHCVHGGQGKQFMQNWVFAPLYRNGVSPLYGVWSAKWFQAADGWKNNTDFDRDVAFVTVWPNAEGKKLVNVVGGNSISMNQGFVHAMTLLAYPAAPPFNGHTQQVCQRTSYRPGTWPFQENQVALDCNFTPGASGGPYLRNYNGSLGDVNGVLSTRSSTGVNRSPYFDDTVLQLYRAAANLT